MFMHADVLLSGLTYQLVTTSHFESNVYFFNHCSSGLQALSEQEADSVDFPAVMYTIAMLRCHAQALQHVSFSLDAVLP